MAISKYISLRNSHFKRRMSYAIPTFVIDGRTGWRQYWDIINQQMMNISNIKWCTPWNKVHWTWTSWWNNVQETITYRESLFFGQYFIWNSVRMDTISQDIIMPYSPRNETKEIFDVCVYMYSQTCLNGRLYITNHCP